MAGGAAGGGGDQTRQFSEFIAALVKDPRNPPEVVEITGYLGASAEAGRTRIYLDTSLQNYVEVMEDKILHVEPVAEGQLGLSHIFIAADAQVFPPEVKPRLDARSVFGGAVYQDYLTAAAGGAPGISPPGGGIGAGPFGPVPPPIAYTTWTGIVCHSLKLSCYRTFRWLCTIPCTYHWICEGPPREEFPVPPRPYAGMAAMGAETGLYQQAAMTPQAAIAQPQWPPRTFPPYCPPRTFPPYCPPHTYQFWCRPSVPVWRCPPPTFPPQCPPRTFPPIRCPWTLPIQCGGLGGVEFGGDPMAAVDPGLGTAGGGYYDPYSAYQTGY
jgi:hypothetical protein